MAAKRGLQSTYHTPRSGVKYMYLVSFDLLHVQQYIEVETLCTYNVYPFI